VAATEKEIMPLLEGRYVIKPLFPKIPVTKYRFEMMDAPATPNGTIPTTPGGVHRLRIPRRDANGERIFSTQLVDQSPNADPAGPRQRIIEARYEIETGEHDFSRAELVKLHFEKTKSDKEKDHLVAKAWS
jgi:hypothetical protein